ncbi:MAG TPA: sugar ABC transporter permease [Pseudonocardiaceae bacterium]|jgi:multiple sugar transport system permease protein|nr:sugar ABC transporter permease [Pseudonocardiaceae bacterium]
MTALTTPAATTRTRTTVRGRRMFTGFGPLLVSPAFLFVLVFVLFPLGFAVYISLTNWPLIGPYHFVGLRNYAQIGQDAVFGSSVRFTLVYTGIVTLPILVLGYLLAVLVRANRFGVTALRTAFFLPFVVGLTTESFMAYLELQPKTGAVNFVLDKLGITDGSTAWLVHSVPAIAAVCVLVVWSASGLTMMLLMAGMQGIPKELYESADVDGASWWRKELTITIPLLRRTIALSLILSVIGSFLAFNQFFILTQGGPDVSTTTVVMWIYQKAFVQLHVGAATALSIILVIAVGVISLVQFLLLRDRTSET